MANHKSAKTRINRNNKRSIINGARRSRVRTFVKKVNAAILENNKEAADESRPERRAAEEHRFPHRFSSFCQNQSSVVF